MPIAGLDSETNGIFRRRTLSTSTSLLLPRYFYSPRRLGRRLDRLDWLYRFNWRMDGWLNRRMNGRLNRRMNGRLNRRMNGRLNRRMNGWLNRRMDGRLNRRMN